MFRWVIRSLTLPSRSYYSSDSTERERLSQGLLYSNLAKDFNLSPKQADLRREWRGPERDELLTRRDLGRRGRV
jgi:hypothetical protein